MKTGLKVVGMFAVVVAASLAVIGACQGPNITLPPGAFGTHVTVAGIPIRYAQAGHGPDVLLLHGSPGSVEDWSPIFDRLSARFRVTAFDRPGHGYSGGAELPHTPEENGRIALELIRALHLQDVVLVGHSYGGITGLAMATHNPAEVRAFVIVASRGYGPVNVDALYRVLAVPFFGAGFAAAVGPWVGPGHIDSGVRASFAPNVDLIPAGFVVDRTKIWNRPTVTTTLSLERVTLAAALDEMGRHYPDIRKPVFLLCGENDEKNYRDAQRLARDIPGAKLVAFPNTGHYVHFAHPDEVVASIEEAARAR